MPTRLFLSLVALVVLPLFGLGWMMSATIRSQQADARDTLRRFLDDQLSQHASQTGQLIRDLRSEYLESGCSTKDPRKWVSDLRRDDPRVQTAFLIDSQNRLLYPFINDAYDYPAALDPGFTRRMREYTTIRELTQGRPTGVDQVLRSSSGDCSAFWMPWYRDQGLQLVLWVEFADDSAVGILLNRAAWMSRLISNLPDSTTVALPTRHEAGQFKTLLVDAQENTVYQWGEDQVTEMTQSSSPSTKVATQDEPKWELWAEVALPQPLSSWRLRYFGDAPLTNQISEATPLILAAIAVSLVLLALGIYVTSSLRRQMRLAEQQVSFAGQVSHELRTPLTNIRLYAELADQDVSQMADSPAKEKLQRRMTIIEQETQRLSRLCSGVLELVKRPHHPQKPRLESIIPDACIEELVEQFRPAMESQAFEIETELHANATCWLDRQGLETVLMNLLSNVEKYAAQGKWLRITSELADQVLIVSVQDHGPGISRRHRDRIFKPFYRIDSSISAPSGTGIGLALARQCAVAAGGSLELEPCARGAHFQLQLPALDEPREPTLGHHVEQGGTA